MTSGSSIFTSAPITLKGEAQILKGPAEREVYVECSERGRRELMEKELKNRSTRTEKEKEKTTLFDWYDVASASKPSLAGGIEEGV